MRSTNAHTPRHDAVIGEDRPPRRAQYVPLLSLFLVASISALSPSDAFAQRGVSATASTSSQIVEVGSNFTYTATVSAQGATEIELAGIPDFGELSVLRQQRTPQFISINGVTQRRLTVQYTLRSIEPGTFTLKGPRFRVSNQLVEIDPIEVRIVERGKAPEPRKRNDDRVQIDVTLQPTRSPWVGQQLLLSYDLMIDAGQLDATPHQMTEPSLDEFWVEDLSERTAGSRQLVSVSGRLMERRTLRTYAAFPLSAGHHTIEPIEVELVTGGFFRRGRELVVESEPIELDVRPLPPDAPASFHPGNVGQWNLRVRSSESSTRVGRPIRVEIIASGEGHLGRVKLPQLPELPGARVAEPNDVVEPHVRNNKFGGTRKAVYDVTPLEEGVLVIPSLEFSYFDTSEGRYVTTHSDPIQVRVAAGELPPAPVPTDELTRRNISGEADVVENLVGQLRPVRDTVDTAPAADPRRFGWWWWLVCAGAMVAFFGAALQPVLSRRWARSAPRREYRASREAALARLRAAGTDPAEVTSAVRDFLDESHDVPRGTVTACEIRRAFERRDLPQDVADDLAWVLERCEAARFAAGGAVEEDVAERAANALQRLPTPTIGRSRSSAGLAVVVLVGFASALLPSNGYGEELAQFRERVERHPSSVDALYNLGTTAATNGDLGIARWALERAAWLAPGDDDVAHNRDVVARIVRVQGIENSRAGRTVEGDELLFWWELMSRLPGWTFGLVLTLSWLASTALLVVRRRTESSIARDGATVALIFTLVMAGTATLATVARAAVLDAATPVVVVDEQVELREGPNPAAMSKRTPPGLVPGTLLRVVDRRGDWKKLVWPGGEGWTTGDLRFVVGAHTGDE